MTISSKGNLRLCLAGVVTMLILARCHRDDRNAPKPGQSSAAAGASASAVSPSASATQPDAAPAPCAEVTRRPSVVEADGNIFLCEDGKERQLTATNQDWSPVLSPDVEHVLFMRNLGKQDVLIGRGPETVSVSDNRVMIIKIGARQPIQVASNSEKEGCLSLAEPRFADATTAIVSSYGYGDRSIHNRAVCVVDLPARAIHLMGRRTRCALPISVGRFRGAFFVAAMGFRVGAGLFDDFRVVDRKGHTLRRYTENPFAIDFDGDGTVSFEESIPGCPEGTDPPRDRIEAVMKKL